jgi:hypothetical protein
LPGNPARPLFCMQAIVGEKPNDRPAYWNQLSVELLESSPQRSTRKKQGENMSLEAEFVTAVTKACGVKRLMCSMHNGPYDLAGMVHFTLRGHAGFGMVLLGKGHAPDTLPKAWAKILQKGSPEYVIVIVESYTDATLGVSGYREFGQLAEDFKNNACSQVRENILLYGLDTSTGRQIAMRVPYTYDDQGMPRFEDAIVWAPTGEGLALGNATIPYILEGCNRDLGRR